VIPAAPGAVPQRSVVTGATGLLGSNIVRTLLAGGGEVTAIVRDRERARRILPAADDLRLVDGDITAVDSFSSSLPGADAIFHAAAYFREYYQPGRDLALLHRTNVTAVDSLLHAAEKADVPTFLYVSSSSTVQPPADGSPADESTPLRTHGANGYAESKIRAEEIVRSFGRNRVMRVPIIVPAWMWGPGDAGPTSSGQMFLSIARRELPAVPAAGNHLVDARDVAAACVRAALGGGDRYIVGGTWRPLPEVCVAVSAAVGVPPPRTVPARAALAAATVLEFQAKLRGRRPTATRSAVKTLIEGNRRRLSSALAEQELGISFRQLDETLADEAAWFREQGSLRAP
jgi:dihydroflavonol-4-reductase